MKKKTLNDADIIGDELPDYFSDEPGSELTQDQLKSILDILGEQIPEEKRLQYNRILNKLYRQTKYFISVKIGPTPEENSDEKQQTQNPATNKDKTEKKQKPQKLSTRISEDLDALLAIAGKYIEVVDSLDEISLSSWSAALTDTLEKPSNAKDLLHQAWNNMLVVTAAAKQIPPQASKGPDQSVYKKIVKGLADIYQDVTGERPSRRYDGSKAGQGTNAGEEGLFLDFVRSFFSHVPEAPERLTRIVREVIAERPRHK
jgi:hypothetical protein